MKEETCWGKKTYSFSSLESIWQRPPGTKTPLCSLLWNLYGTLNGIGMSNKGSWHPPVLTAMSTPWFFFILKFSFSLFSLISGKIAGTNPGTWALILHLYIHSSRPGKACVSVMQRHVPDSLASPLLWCPLRSGRAQRLRCPVPRTKWQTVHE